MTMDIAPDQLVSAQTMAIWSRPLDRRTAEIIVSGPPSSFDPPEVFDYSDVPEQLVLRNAEIAGFWAVEVILRSDPAPPVAAIDQDGWDEIADDVVEQMDISMLCTTYNSLASVHESVLDSLEARCSEPGMAMVSYDHVVALSLVKHDLAHGRRLA